jgi:fructose-bisphosphate aldolase, class I
MTNKIEKILSYYDSDNPGTKNNLCRILMHGKLAGTGNLVILPVDQGFEHGPDKSFAKNPPAYDPDYHYELAIEAGLSAYAAPLGMIESGASKFVGKIPTILKLSSSNALLAKSLTPDQAITASVDDALRLGCAAVGLTIYPGSDKSIDMIEEAREIIKEAKSKGLATVIWSYPRGGDLSKEDETALDVCSYAAHIAALIGAHIIKVKIPTSHIMSKDSGITPTNSIAENIKHVVRACFNGKRIVVFSGGAAKSEHEIFAEVNAIKLGGGNGSIIGRNSFQRPKKDALELLSKICKVYSHCETTI